MKMIPNAVTFAAARSLLKTQKASPQLLFASGLAGMGATIVLACRATLRLDEVLEDAQKDLMRVDEAVSHPTENVRYTEKDYKHDKAAIYIRSAVTVGKLYGPAILVGAASVAALTGSHNILNKRNAALAAAYGTIEQAFRQYRERIAEELGEEKERDLYYGLEKCEIDDPEKPGKKKIGMGLRDGVHSPYARFFCKEASRSWMTTAEYNLLFLRAQQEYCNQMLQSRGHVLLNDVYDGLGLDRTSAGAVVGWVKDTKDGDNYIDFGVLEGQNQDRFYDFMVSNEGIWLDFNVDGVVYEKI